MAISVGHLIKENHTSGFYFHPFLQIMNAAGALIDVVLDELARGRVIFHQAGKAFHLFTRGIGYFRNERIGTIGAGENEVVIAVGFLAKANDQCRSSYKPELRKQWHRH
jgi:hypothetical protein